MSIVSIIVPVYKVERYLKRCIDSILSQTYSDFEVVLVDDGSPDNCPSICDEYAKIDSRIIVIHKENGGLSSARNAGLEIASGKYVLFVDSDDFIKSNLLENCVNIIENFGCDSVRFGYEKIAENQKYLSTHSPACKTYYFNDSISRLQFIHNDLLSYSIPFTAWSCLFKNSIIKEHNLRFVSERIIYSEDTFFSVLYTFYSSSCIAISDCFYVYRDNKNSLMGTYKRQNVLHINKCVEWSKRLYQICEDDYIKEHFYFITVAFYKNELWFNVKRSNVNKIISSVKVLDDKYYFSSQFKKYYEAIKSEYRVKFGRKQTFKDFTFIKYFISFKTILFRIRIGLIRLFRM